MAEGWREVFESSRLVPPHSQTVRLAADSHSSRSHGFQLSLSRLTAAHRPEVLYFHTSLQLPSTVVVLELVSLSPRPDGSLQALGRGFTVLELFTNKPEAQAADGDR
eukprot:superscaffoldBa00001559_g11081